MAIPLDTNSRTDDIVDAISRLVLEGGFERVTMRAIAQQVRISPGTLANHLSNRERLLRVCAFGFADRRMRELDHQVRRVGAVGLMPMDDHDLRSARVWLAWRELARNAEGPAHAVAGADVKEEWLLRVQATDPRADHDHGGDVAGRLLPDARCSCASPRCAACGRQCAPRASTPWTRAAARELWLAHLESAQLGAAASARARSSATIASGSSAE